MTCVVASSVRPNKAAFRDIARSREARRFAPPGLAIAALLLALIAGCDLRRAEEPGPPNVAVRALSSDVVWRQVANRPGTSYGANAYDSARGKVWRFTVNTTRGQGEMWAWDGEAWILVGANGGPVTPSGPNTNLNPLITYDSKRQSIVLVGHSDTTQIWLWDGVSWTFPFPQSLTDLPPVREGEAITYDAARGKVVMFGGTDTRGTAFNDTWEWDGTWTLRSGSGASPPAGSGSMAYDPSRRKSVLLVAGDTWEWDGSVWEQRAVATTPPLSGSLAYDDARKAVLVLSGTSSTQLWQWDGRTWQALPSTVSPPWTSGGIVYDSRRDRLVAHDEVSSSTWEWDGTTWMIRAAIPPGGPMAYDRARRQIVMATPGALWIWNGARWEPKPLADGGAVPTPGPLAYDSDRQKLVMFNGQTWEWDGARWELVTTSDSPTSEAGAALAMTYDEARKVTLLSTNSETWTWDGGTWTRLAPRARPNGTSKVMAYDDIRQKIVLFIGNDKFSPSETWEWDGAEWTRLAAGPDRQYGPGMVYHALLGKTVMVGLGSWTWDGQAWATLAGNVAPPDRQKTHAAFDSDRQTLVVFGGRPQFLGLPAYDDTWELGPSWVRCDDATPCAKGQCVDGVCCATTATTCGPCQACNVPGAEGTCAPKEGTCDDGDTCTTSDHCEMGACVGSPLLCVSPGECQIGLGCDGTQGCLYGPLPDGTACAGSTNMCDPAVFDPSTCLASMCLGGACVKNLCFGVTCPAGDACHAAGVCDRSSGQCSAEALPDGTACDDQDPATSGDRCQAGVCVGTRPEPHHHHHHGGHHVHPRSPHHQDRG